MTFHIQSRLGGESHVHPRVLLWKKGNWSNSTKSPTIGFESADEIMLRHLADETKPEVLNTLAPSWRRLRNFPRYMSQSPFPLAFHNGEVEVQIRELVTRQG